ncbi:T9SS type A sorting domain-containing protein [Flavobacterium sp.]|uniref:T9SS type A sorting domain-containing protein n=1 Tax=Flavobacterium sp. TaxID=239 RepID=UPI0039E39674
MKKIYLLTTLFLLLFFKNYAQKTENPINNEKVSSTSSKSIQNLSCVVNGINITTTGTQLGTYNTPTVDNSCPVNVSTTTGVIGTGTSNTGWIRYTFSSPVSSVTIGYSSVNSHDSGLISINNPSGVFLSNPCGVYITGNNVITGNNFGDETLYGDINIRVSAATLGATFTQITLTNISGLIGSGWASANACNFIIHPTQPTSFSNCLKIYLDSFCYNATQSQTTAHSVFNGTIIDESCFGMPCLINGLPCSSSNVILELEEPLPFGCILNPNGTVTFPPGTMPFYHEFNYRLRSIANGAASIYYRASIRIHKKVLPASPTIYIDADGPINGVYSNGSVNILNGAATSQINTSTTGVCGYIPSVIGQPNVSNTVSIIETTTPQNPYYRINTGTGAIVFRPPYNASNPPPVPTLPEKNYYLTYQMCINNTGAVSFCENGQVTIHHYYDNFKQGNKIDTKNISIYPNPSLDGNFTVSLEDNKTSFDLEVYDMLGQLIYFKEKNHSNDILINLTTFSKGIYLIKIKSDDEVINKNIVIK